MKWYDPRTWGQEKPRRQYAGAVVDRLTHGWRANSTSADVEVVQSLDKLRARARQLDRDNPWAAGARQTIVDNVVGITGIQPRAKLRVGNVPGGTLDDKANKRIEAAYWRWAKARNCDAEGTKSITQIQRLSVSTWFQGGEFLIRKVSRGVFDPRGVDLKLQLLEPDFLDHTFHREAGDEGNRVIGGIEIDRFGAPVAYHLYTRHPGEHGAGQTRERERVPASEIIHAGIPLRAGQRRMPPVMHAVMRRLNDIDGYEEAERVAARVAAGKLGFFYVDGGELAPEPADGSAPQFDGKAGTFSVLPEGYRFEGWDPQHPNSAFDAFMLAMLRGVAAGVNMSYESVTRDYSRTSFSSARTALLSEREAYRALQDWYAETVMQPIFGWFMEAASRGVFLREPIAQYLDDAEACLDSVLWRGRSWGWVDPAKEVQARKEELKAGLTTLTRVYDEMGLDFEAEMATAKHERDLLKSMGLSFDFLGLQVLVPAQAAAPVDGKGAPAPAPDAPADAVPADVGGEATTAPDISLNGAQVTALLEVINAVATGALPRETGVQIIAVAFALSTEQAEAVMGEVGKTFTVESPAAEAAEPPDEQTATEENDEGEGADAGDAQRAALDEQGARALMRLRGILLMRRPASPTAKPNGKHKPAHEWSFDA